MLTKDKQRAVLQEKIESLQKQLDNLELDGAPRATKKNKLSVEQVIGPLPPGLAAAPKRHIALKFVYDGWAHSGLAYQPMHSYTPYPTVEGCILKALEVARLIEPMEEVEGFGCGFERCGRTDAGVSSSAQVINLWVRSDLADPMGTGIVEDEASETTTVDSAAPATTTQLNPPAASTSTSEPTPLLQKKVRRKPPADFEIPYVTILNKHLPPTIRMIAWSPVSSTFSSRYSCIWRHYKYFFSRSPVDPFLRPRFDTGSAYPPAATDRSGDNLENMKWEDMGLDVEKMREAIALLNGDHDFRNLCKVDPTKQLSTHRRTVVSATIDAVPEEGPDMFVLNLRGGAFLYNQVRHIVAILLLVGARLEPPSVVANLLWTSDRSPETIAMHGNKNLSVLDRKPSYGMADDLPLVLWECGFNSSELDWRLDEVEAGKPDKQMEIYRRQFLDMNRAWTETRLKSIIGRHHMAALAAHAPPPLEQEPRMLYWTPLGGGQFVKTSNYIPLLQRKRGDVPDEVNRRWAEGRGQAKMAKRAANQVTADAARAINMAKKEEAYRLAQEGAKSEGSGLVEGLTSGSSSP